MEDREMADQRIHTFIIRTKKERKKESIWYCFVVDKKPTG